ncbi:MAG: hypothetical protein MRY60_03510 [Algiphilus sp.]|nr:hypothetical protein [Algiphilus sp.]MCI5102825.1 hypothetical protein [Algiphilus sp.]
MSDDQQGSAFTFAGIAQQCDDFLRVVVIEAGSWFVRQQDRGLVDQCARNGDALRFALRQGIRHGMGTMRQAELIKQRQRSRTVRRTSAEVLGEHQVLQHVHGAQQVESLKDETDVLPAKAIARRRAECADILSGNVERPGIGHQQAGEDMQQRGLAASGWSQQQMSLAGFQVQMIQRECGLSSETMADVLRFDQSGHEMLLYNI